MGTLTEQNDGSGMNENVAFPVQSDENPLIYRPRRRENQIADYILPAALVEFQTPLPTPPRYDSDQPLELYEAIIPHLPKSIDYLGDLFGSPAEQLRRDYHVVFVPNQEEGHTLAIDYPSRTTIFREMIDPTAQEEVQAEIKSKLPTDYEKMVAEAHPDDPNLRIDSGWRIQRDVSEMRSYNQAFDILNHMVAESQQQAIRVEFQEVFDYKFKHSRSPEGYHNTAVVSLPEEKLIPYIYQCTPDVYNSKPALRIETTVPWFESEHTADETLDAVIYMTEDDIAVPDELMSQMIERIRAEGKDVELNSKWNDGFDNDPEYYMKLLFKLDWNSVVNSLVFAGRQRERYFVHAFGQELTNDRTKSIRVFDSTYAEPTTRPVEEVANEIYLTDEEIAQRDKEDEELRRWWIDEMLPTCREWSPEQQQHGAEYLRDHATDPVALLKGKFESGTRLATVGLFTHPLDNDFISRIFDEIPNVDFIALESRPPTEPNVPFQDEKGFVSLHLPNGVIMEVSAEEAEKNYPEEYKNLRRPSHVFDSILGKARLIGADIIHTIDGNTYEEAVQHISDSIADYMKQHPQAKGIYFASPPHALKWPGYTEEDLQDEEKRGSLGARPFINIYTLAEANRNDPRLKMPMGTLEQQFPGQVYTLMQFPMPRGFGKEWRNLKQSVQSSELSDYFAVDNLRDTPFALQRYITYMFPELASWPEEDLWMMLGAAGPLEINWGKLVDGIFILPSDEEEPKKPSQEDLMQAFADVIVGQLKNIEDY